MPGVECEKVEGEGRDGVGREGGDVRCVARDRVCCKSCCIATYEGQSLNCSRLKSVWEEVGKEEEEEGEGGEEGEEGEGGEERVTQYSSFIVHTATIAMNSHMTI